MNRRMTMKYKKLHEGIPLVGKYLVYVHIEVLNKGWHI